MKTIEVKLISGCTVELYGHKFYNMPCSSHTTFKFPAQSVRVSGVADKSTKYRELCDKAIGRFRQLGYDDTAECIVNLLSAIDAEQSAPATFVRPCQGCKYNIGTNGARCQLGNNTQVASCCHREEQPAPEPASKAPELPCHKCGKIMTSTPICIHCGTIPIIDNQPESKAADLTERVGGLERRVNDLNGSLRTTIDALNESDKKFVDPWPVIEATYNAIRSGAAFEAEKWNVLLDVMQQSRKERGV